MNKSLHYIVNKLQLLFTKQIEGRIISRRQIRQLYLQDNWSYIWSVHATYRLKHGACVKSEF